ncbi:MAG: TonB-dependent receptor plug domain-containing protein, partial [bacterium]
MRPAWIVTAMYLSICLGLATGILAGDGEAAAEADSSGTQGGSPVTAVESPGVVADSLGAVADSSGTQGSSPVNAVESPGVVADSLGAVADSLGAVADSLPADSLAFKPLDITLMGNTISGLRGVFALDYAVAGREEMLEFISSDPAEGLVMDSGIRYITRGFYGGPQYLSIRGRDPRATGYLMDGVPVTDPQIEVFDPHWLPIEGTERIESIKGPATALFGGGATGGLVNVVSHDVLVPVPLTKVNVWFGSYDTRLVGADFMRSIGNNFGFIGAYDYFSTAGYVDGANYRMEKLYGKVSARFPSSLKFDIIAYRHVGDTGVLGAHYTDRIDSRSFLDLSFEVGTESVFDLDLYYFDVRETFRGASDETYEGSQAGASLVWTGTESTDYVRRLGASFKRKNSEEVDGIGEGSAFGEFSYVRGDFGSRAVLRAEKNSEHDTQYALALPLTYGISRRVRLFGRLDRGFTYPLARGARESHREEVETTAGFSGGISCECNVLELSINVFYYDIEGASIYRTDETCLTRLVEGAAFDLLGAEAQVYLPPVYGFEGTVSFSRGDSRGEIEGAGELQPANVLAWGIKYRRQFTRHIGTGVTFAGRWSSGTSLGHRWEC